MAYSTLAAIYETPAAAKAAAAELVSADFHRDDIKLFPTDTDDADDAGTTSSSTRSADERGGFFGWLFGKDQPEAEVTHYNERFEKGNSALSLRVEDARHDEAADILESHNPVDVDQHSDTGQTEAMNTTDAAGLSTAGAVGTTTKTTTETTSEPMPAFGAARSATDDGSLQLVEEKLSVGKRQVQGGRVRLRTYTVETPVSETIRLRDEKISIDRHAANGGVKLGADPFKERTIEMTESREEAVVGKNVRVKEEVSLDRESVDRDQVVSDTVRHTEVDIDRDGDGAVADSSLTDRSRHTEADRNLALGTDRTTTVDKLGTSGGTKTESDRGIVDKAKAAALGNSTGATEPSRSTAGKPQV